MEMTQMKSISVADADLLRLLDEVANGETFVITKDDRPVAQLAPLNDVEQPERVRQRSRRRAEEHGREQHAAVDPRGEDEQRHADG